MSDQGNVYVQRINLVLDYIREHATEDLSVERLARVAAFSPHHFHRLFTTLTGETVNQCVVRMRLERAAALMKAAPTRPVTEIAATCGFTSLPVFSRGFKKQFGMSPTQWDRNSPLKDSKNRQALEGLSRYTIAELSEMSEQNAFAVTLRDMPAQRTAFIRVTDAYRPGRLEEAYDRLIAWVRAHGRMPTEFTLLGMSQDDPDVVPKALCRYDVCLTVPDTWTAGGRDQHPHAPSLSSGPRPL